MQLALCWFGAALTTQPPVAEHKAHRSRILTRCHGTASVPRNRSTVPWQTQGSPMLNLENRVNQDQADSFRIRFLSLLSPLLCFVKVQQNRGPTELLNLFDFSTAAQRSRLIETNSWAVPTLTNYSPWGLGLRPKHLTFK